MKLSTVTARLTSMKSSAVKLLAVTALAGAALAAAPAAEAQHVVVGVRFGGPRYFAPAPPVVYGRPGFYAGYGYRHDDWRFHHEPYRGGGWRR
jgi:hypothetical protein